MKIFLNFMKVWLGLSFFYCCTPVYYIPQSANIPLLTKKGQANIGASSSLTSFSGNTAYAFTNNISAQINISKTKYKVPTDFIFSSSDYTIKYSQLNAGLGFTHKLSNKLIAETYLIGCKGIFQNNYLSDGNFFDIHFEDIYGVSSKIVSQELAGKFYALKLQNSIAYTHSFFTLIATVTINKLQYFNVVGDLTFYGRKQTDYIHQYPTYYFLEPSLTGRFSSDAYHFQFQYLYSACLTNQNFMRVRNVFSASIYKTLNLKRNKK